MSEKLIEPEAARKAAEAVPGIPRDAAGPVFRAPWEAHAFAMALALTRKRSVRLARVVRDAWR